MPSRNISGVLLLFAGLLATISGGSASMGPPDGGNLPGKLSLADHADASREGPVRLPLAMLAASNSDEEVEQCFQACFGGAADTSTGHAAMLPEPFEHDRGSYLPRPFLLARAPKQSPPGPLPSA